MYTSEVSVDYVVEVRDFIGEGVDLVHGRSCTVYTVVLEELVDLSEQCRGDRLSGLLDAANFSEQRFSLHTVKFVQ